MINFNMRAEHVVEMRKRPSLLWECFKGALMCLGALYLLEMLWYVMLGVGQ